jgi:hypothetical protein
MDTVVIFQLLNANQKAKSHFLTLVRDPNSLSGWPTNYFDTKGKINEVLKEEQRLKESRSIDNKNGHGKSIERRRVRNIL